MRETQPLSGQLQLQQSGCHADRPEDLGIRLDLFSCRVRRDCLSAQKSSLHADHGESCALSSLQYLHIQKEKSTVSPLQDQQSETYLPSEAPLKHPRSHGIF